MKRILKRLISAVCIAIILAVSIPVVKINLDRIKKMNSPFVAYAALQNRLDTLGGLVHRDSYDDTIKEAEEKKKQLEAKKAQVKKEIASLNTEYDKLSKYVQELDLKQNEIALSLYEITQEIEQTEAELAQVQIQLETAEATAQAQFEAMKHRVQLIYEDGEATTWELLLSSRSLSDLLNAVEYASSISNYDKELLRQYNETCREVSDYKLYLEAKNESLQLSKEMYEQDQLYAEALIETKTEAMEAYAAKIGTNTYLLNQYLTEIENQTITIAEAEKQQAAAIKKAKEEEERRLAEEKKKAEAGQPVQAPASTGANNAASIVKTDVTDLSKAIWPYPGCSRTGSGFGPRIPPTAGASSFHKGLDIGGTTGDQIVSILAGKVIEASYNSSGGFHVYVDHGNGVISRYLHFSRLMCSTGDYVQQGQVIGLVGNTGISTSAHLHFCIYINGEPVDPARYVKY